MTVYSFSYKLFVLQRTLPIVNGSGPSAVSQPETVRAAHAVEGTCSKTEKLSDLSHQRHDSVTSSA